MFAETFELIDPNADVGKHPQVTTFTIKVSQAMLGSHQLKCFTSWKILSQAIAILIHKVRSCTKSSNGKTDELTQAKLAIIRATQHDALAEEMKLLYRGDGVPKSSPLRKLQPISDADGLLRVGGHLSLVAEPKEERHSIIVSKKQHMATLLVRHYHERVTHQGRHLTEGSVCSAGL